MTWVSRKQRLIANGSTYAEYITLFHSTLESRAIHNYMNAFAFLPPNVWIFCDNQAAQLHAKTLTSANATASRHWEVCYHLIRKAIQRKEFTIHHIESQNNLADLFTKPLSRHLHEKHCRTMNLLKKR